MKQAGMLFAVALFAGGCGGGDRLSGPPTLRMGRDECAECGMGLSEERCAAASIMRQDGVDAYVLFDDVGCMLDHEQEHHDSTVSARYVHDYDTKAWLEADEAFFLFAEKLQTPMGSGIGAFGSREGADAKQRQSGGAIMNWSEIGQARIKWRHEKLDK